MRVIIKPRVQKDKWSLYWKTSMVTRTETLDEFPLEVEPTSTAKELKARVASELGWAPVDELLRLEGFVEPWELCCCKGIELEENATLQSSGIKDNDEIVTVRKVLVAEGASSAVALSRKRAMRVARLRICCFYAVLMPSYGRCEALSCVCAYLPFLSNESTLGRSARRAPAAVRQELLCVMRSALAEESRG